MNPEGRIIDELINGDVVHFQLLLISLIKFNSGFFVWSIKAVLFDGVACASTVYRPTFEALLSTNRNS